jgi:hypothetical protein
MNKTYITSDTAEASYLMAHDVQFVKIVEYDHDNKKGIELQEVIEGQIADLLLAWGNGHCPEKAFFLKYKWILKQVAPKNNGN